MLCAIDVSEKVLYKIDSIFLLMGFKDWPYWLKGGIISILLIILISIILIPFGSPDGELFNFPYWSYTLTGPAFFLGLGSEGIIRQFNLVEPLPPVNRQGGMTGFKI